MAANILNQIESAGIENEPIQIDVTNIITMTTKCAKKIFGSLYKKLGYEKYYSNVIFKGKSETLSYIIDSGIEDVISNSI